MTSSVLLLSQPSFFVCIIISFRPAWLARALLSFKRAQSSGNDDVDEGQHAPFGAPVISQSHFLVQLQLKIDSLGTSSTVWLTKAVDISVGYPVHVVVYTVPSLRRPPVLLVCHGAMRIGKLQFTLSHRTNYHALRSTGA